jgi:hypothetical protein
MAAAKLRTKKTQTGKIDPLVARVLQRMQESQSDLARQIEQLALAGPPGPPGAAGANGADGAPGADGGLPGFDPTSIADLLEWFKADGSLFSDAGVTPVANGDRVYQWNDESGNGFHYTQATLGARPIYYAPPSGSALPRVYFDSNRYLQRANETGIDAASFTIIASAVLSNKSADRRDIYATYHQPADKGFALGLKDGTASVPRITGDANNVLATNNHDLSSERPFVLAATYDGGTTNRALWLNGREIASDAGSTVTYDGGPPTIGYLGYLGASYGWLGDINEILVYSRALTDDELTDVMGYLTRWGQCSKGMP